MWRRMKQREVMATKFGEEMETKTKRRRNVDERNSGRKTKPAFPLENRENVGTGNR